jgi:hypothetical protein
MPADDGAVGAAAIPADDGAPHAGAPADRSAAGISRLSRACSISG